MSFSLLPKLITDELTDLTPELLKARNIGLLMMDFDNTIVPYTTDVPTEKMAAWLEMMKQSDIRICVVSNSHNSRVPSFCDKYGIPCITHAKSPVQREFGSACKSFPFLRRRLPWWVTRFIRIPSAATARV